VVVRKGILCAAIGSVAAAVLIGLALLPRSSTAARASRRVELSDSRSTPAPTLHERIRALPSPPEGVDRAEIVALVREAADAYRGRDFARSNRAFQRLLSFGSKIQRVLAEILLEEKGLEERAVAGQVLRQVATAEIGPVAVALVQARVPEDVQALAIDLLTKFQVAEAAPVLESLLFEPATSADLKGRALEFFIAMRDSAILARASVEPSLGDLRTNAADGLAKIGTPEAALLLLNAWRAGFDPTKGRALSNYYLLQALARMESGLLRGLIRDFLRAESNPSAKNVFLSMLARSDKALALETLKTVLKEEASGPVRKQAMRILSSLGSAEAQEILLGILGSARSDRDLVEVANALLQNEKLEVSFDKVRRLHGSSTDPLLRALLAGILGKYVGELEADAALVGTLRREAEDGMASADPAVRGLSVQLSTALAQFDTDPASRLIGLYGTLSETERNAFPQVFSELAKQTDDPRVKLVLERAVGDDSASTPNRLLAADALFTSGGAEKVYGAIASTKNPELTALFVGVALARGGNEAASRLDRLAQASEDTAKKHAIADQLRAWSVTTK